MFTAGQSHALTGEKDACHEIKIATIWRRWFGRSALVFTLAFSPNLPSLTSQKHILVIHMVTRP